MHLERIDLLGFRELYREIMSKDFPPHELRSLEGLEALFHKELSSCYCLVDFGVILGYALLSGSKKGEAQLMDYFAINNEYRAQGLGSHLLHRIMDESENIIYFEVEVPSCADNPSERRLREKRLEFYQRNGAVLSPLLLDMYGETFHILYSLPIHPTQPDFPKSLEPEQIEADLHEIYRDILSKKTYDSGLLYWDEDWLEN